MSRFVAATMLWFAWSAAKADDGDRPCIAWAQEIVQGAADACSELCPQAQQFDQYDYRAGLQAAFASEPGLQRFLSYVGRSTVMGSGAEAHACSVRALLVHWGDQRFAASLTSQPAPVKEQAIGLLDYTAIADFQSRFPQTYQLGSHEQTIDE